MHFVFYPDLELKRPRGRPPKEFAELSSRSKERSVNELFKTIKDEPADRIVLTGNTFILKHDLNVLHNYY
jgi:hypothetical protein